MFHNIPIVKNLHKLESLIPYTSDHNQIESKGGNRIRTQEHNATTHTNAKKRVQQQNDKVTSQKFWRCGLEVSEL
jgi:hypothetical protein